MQYRIVQAFNDINRERDILQEFDNQGVPVLLDYIPPHITDFCPFINLPLDTNLHNICKEYPKHSIVFYKCYKKDYEDWNPCFYIMLRKYLKCIESCQLNLDNDDDCVFLSQVMDIVISGLSDFDIAYILSSLMKKLYDGSSVLSILEYSETLTGIIVNEFLYADIKGGMYNKRLIELANVKFNVIDI